MYQPLSANTVTAIVISVVLFHIALAVAGVFNRKVNPLYLLAAAFIVLSPISAAITLPGFYLAKWGRVYAAVVMVVVGLLGFRIYRIGLASKVMLAFVTFFVFAAFWSKAPIMGLLLKGLFAVTVIAGMFLAYSVRDRDELARGLRWLAIVSAFAGLVAFGVFLSDPRGALAQGRLAFWGMNPNRIGLTAAPLLILCSYMAFFDRSRFWKGFGYLVSGLLAIVLLYTGSRAAVGTAAVGCLIVALPLIKRPVRAAIIVTAAGIFGWVAVQNIQTAAVERLTDVKAASQAPADLAKTRIHVWRDAMKDFRKHPIIGTGWVHTYTRERYSTRNLHNMYLQSLAETGVIGTSMLCLSFLFALLRGVKMYVSARRYATISSLAALPLGLLLSLLVHGVGESGTLMGSTLNSLFLGFSVGLIDYLPHLAKDEIESASSSRTLLYRLTPRLSRRGRGRAGPEAAT